MHRNSCWADVEIHLAEVLCLAAQVVAAGDGERPQRRLSCQVAHDADDLTTELCGQRWSVSLQCLQCI